MLGWRACLPRRHSSFFSFFNFLKRQRAKSRGRPLPSLFGAAFAPFQRFPAPLLTMAELAKERAIRERVEGL